MSDAPKDVIRYDTIKDDEPRNLIDKQTKDLWLSIRQGLLMIVDGIERYLSLEPRTADLRKMVKQLRRDVEGQP